MAAVLVLSICFMMLSFASVQGYPSRPNAGYEDLLARIEQALDHPSRPSRPSRPNAGYEDLLATIEQALDHPSRPNAGYEDLLARIEQAPGYPSRPSHQNAGYEELLATIERRPGFCYLSGLSPGCCEGFCRTFTGCYCDRICKIYRDCCWDVPKKLQCAAATPSPSTPPPTEPSTPPPTEPSTSTPTESSTPPPPTAPAQNSCSDKYNGCCTGDFVACAVGSGLNTCHCNVECHSTNTCCHDIATINCFPHNCAQAGKVGCVTAPGEMCDVITSHDGTGTCYCDDNCSNSKDIDCCDDAGQLSGQDLGLLLLSELKKIEELTQLMESSHTYNRRDTRAENLRRRYREGLLGAQM